MKRILYVVGIGLVVGLGYWAFMYEEEETFMQPEAPKVEVKPEPTPEELMEQATQKLIVSAIAASSTEIEAAKSAEANKVETKMKLEIEKKVRDGIAAQNDTRQQEIEEKLSF